MIEGEVRNLSPGARQDSRRVRPQASPDTIGEAPLLFFLIRLDNLRASVISLLVVHHDSVDRSIDTLTSIEPQVGEIAIQESPIQSLLGIDDIAFMIVGFVVMGIGVVLFAIFQRRARFNSIEEYEYE